MKVKYIGETYFMGFTHGKVYEVVSVEKDWYRIYHDSPGSSDYLYPPKFFEVLAD